MASSVARSPLQVTIHAGYRAAQDALQTLDTRIITHWQIREWLLATVRKIHADTADALADPAIRGRLEELGLFVIGSTPAELGRFLKSEMEKWGPLIKDAGISIRE